MYVFGSLMRRTSVSSRTWVLRILAILRRSTTLRRRIWWLRRGRTACAVWRRLRMIWASRRLTLRMLIILSAGWVSWRMMVGSVVFSICIIKGRWWMVSIIVFSVIFFWGIQVISLQISVPRPRTWVICVVRTISFIVGARSVVGVVRMVCFISWRRTSMIGIIRTMVCIILSCNVGVVGVASFSRPASCPSLSQVSNDIFWLDTDCNE